MNKTKLKIIQAAIDLFNENGISNVRNQDIANKSGISLSNFNYHFGTKKELFFAIIHQMQEWLNNEVYAKNKDFNRGYEITKNYFEFEYHFRFFFFDTYNILSTYPELKLSLKKQIETAIEMTTKNNQQSLEKGYFKAPPKDKPKIYEELAKQIWINNHFWFAQANINGDTNNIIEKGLQGIRTLCYPYLTEKGKKRMGYSTD